jgi:hypothetical protein
MKKMKLFRPFALAIILSIGIVETSEAHPWFGSEEKSLGKQYAGDRVYMEAVEVASCFFGIQVDSHIEQREVACD